MINNKSPEAKTIYVTADIIELIPVYLATSNTPSLPAFIINNNPIISAKTIAILPIKSMTLPEFRYL